LGLIESYARDELIDVERPTLYQRNEKAGISRKEMDD